MVGPRKIDISSRRSKPNGDQDGYTKNTRRLQQTLSTVIRKEGLPTEVVIGNVFFLDTQIVEHLEHGRVHHRWAADVVLDVFRSGMVLQIVVVQHLMNEAGVTVPIVLGLRFGEGDVELEVGKLLLDLAEVIHIEQFPHTATTVPIRHLAIGLEVLEQLEDVAPQRCHACPTADVDHFGISVLDKELAVGSGDRHLVSRLATENVRRHLSRWRPIRSAWRGTSHADIKHDDPLFAGIVGHRVGPRHSLVDLRHVAPDVVLVPIAAEPLVDVEVFVSHFMRRALDLNVAPRLEVDIFPFGQFQQKFFDKGGHVAI